ncbi:type II toxin-antitoxin system CcdA family antitoxin [Roseibium sediminicola]|uniref:Type II toxin-antitoxin system CcdA family antitoxin n=1 Tax=Roseibium sediminicola TaxID=2933272 RepID=A0ABT0GXG2_9HYPH|nr:type II toxin-antitoxin system CcdA family antitoxin [Roseibium sp. CAU 1639]MCK7614132.1 type II toxin-antitoxin system CcdA family antitoxin [Roseibium sp. CAU 1639]
MAPKIPVSIPVDPRLAKQAGDLKVDLSKAAEDGLTRAVQEERERLWRLENAGAIEAANAFVDENGLPFDRHRQF